MNEGPSSENPAADPQTATDLRAFLKLFTAGVLGWVAGLVILFGLSWVLSRPVNVMVAIVWTISHSWGAFLFGVLVLVVHGWIAGHPLGRAGLAFILPVGLLAGIAWLCLWVYPDHALREDLLVYLPMVLMFYGMALLWIWVRRGSDDAFARALMPTMLGGLVILGFVAVPVFASDAFRYRNAFQFTISKMEMRDGKFVAEGTLGIREPGRYQFTAPRYFWSPDIEESEMEAGVITWGGAGAPQADVTGVFPLQIVWSRALCPEGAVDLGAYFEDAIQLEVRDPDKEGRVIYSLIAPMQVP